MAEARRRAGLTQEQLAKQLGTTQAAVTRLERGRFFPSIRTLRRLAGVLGVSFEIGPDGGLAIHSGLERVMTLEDLRARRDEILEIAAADGAHNVRVFGSVARGDAGPESDIDFVVDFDAGYSLMNLSGLHVGLEALLGRAVHVTTLPDDPSSERERRVADRIRREAVPL
jgi:predicted nucleotidyltransferase